MPKRKGLSNKIRFEVFKRDSFKCQYCGGTAPEVLLHVDHIKPVAKGGTNTILNLITSCFACNIGKGARELDDNSEIAKQRRSLEELNERRAQLEMMFKWREGMDSIEEDVVNKIIQDVEKRFKCKLNEFGKSKIRTAYRASGLEDTMAAIKVCELRFLIHDLDNKCYTNASIDEAVIKIPGSAKYLKVERDDPQAARLLYVRGILRNKCSYIPWRCMSVLNNFKNRGVDVEDLVMYAKNARSFTGFESDVENGEFE